MTGLNGETAVQVPDHGSMSLRDALTDRFEIAHISPALLRFMLRHTDDQQLADLLKPENKAALADWTWGRHSVDLLGQCKVTASVDEWLSVLKPLQPRLYSISSSPRSTQGNYT